MPYFGCPQTVRRAVDSVLNQTMGDLRLVVVVDDPDGIPPGILDDITDPRLVVFRLDENNGRYFADAVALASTQSEWFAVCDADDEVAVTWLAEMLDATRFPNTGRSLDWVSTAQRVEGASGVFNLEKPKEAVPRATLTHYAHMGGLWRTSWLRNVAGGMHPGFRVGYDTLLSMIARAFGAGINLPQPLYTRYRRPGSLTTAPKTGMRSRYRAEERVRLTRLWQRIRELPPNSSETPRSILVTEDRQAWVRVAAYAETFLREHGFDGRDDDRLDAARYAIATVLATKAPRHPSAPLVEPPAAFEAVPPTPDRFTGMPWTTVAARWQAPWVLGQATAAELDAFLVAKRPLRIAEFGSGMSTLVLAAHAKHYGAELAVFEHDLRYFARTESMLKDVGLWTPGLVEHRPLAPGVLGPHYGEMPAELDFALVDGPPEATGGRREIVTLLNTRMHPGGRVWLDDVGRPNEQLAIEDWVALTFGRKDRAVTHTWGGRKVAELLLDDGTPQTWAHNAPLPGTVVITLLAGGRPHLLKRTIEGIRPLLDLAQVSLHVQLNQPDEPSRAVAAELLDDLAGRITVSFPADRAVMPIGQAVTECARAAADSGAEFWLHLEDDWLADTADEWWLHRACGVLNRRAGVGQVRLRHIGERTLPYHMLTKRAITWTADLDLGAQIAAEAHWTFNPSLVRTSHIAGVFAAAGLTGERHAQEITHNAGYRGVAQLYPGAFRHLGGGGESLADRTGGR